MKETPSQTAGPFVHIGLAGSAINLRVFEHEAGVAMVGPRAVGCRVTVTGRVLDGEGALVCDALIECRQADGDGRYTTGQDFAGFGRVWTDFKTGEYTLQTIKPGATRVGTATAAPHLLLFILARGINIGLHTRVYFADDAHLFEIDPVLARTEPSRRATLVALRDAQPDAQRDAERDAQSADVYRLDIVLQGDRETVFFDV